MTMTPLPEPTAGDKLSVPSLVEEIVKQIRKLVISGELMPGDRLIEERLSERFGVSRPPMREALRFLQRDGIIQSRRRRGFIVSPITAQDVREIYSLRYTLERMAIELGVPAKDPAVLEPLRQAMENIRTAVAEGEQYKVVSANIAFHSTLIGIAGHSRLNAIWDTLQVQMQMCMAFNLKLRQETERDSGESVSRHEQLLNLIEAGDPTAVLDALEQHGDRSFLDRLDELITDRP